MSKVIPGPSMSRTTSGDRRARPSVFVLVDDPEFAEEIRGQLGNFGYEVSIFADPGNLEDAIRSRPPGALIVDAGLWGAIGRAKGTRGSSAGVDPRSVPTVFVSDVDNWQARIDAIRAGGSAFLPRPVNVMLLVEELDALTGGHNVDDFRVLVVDGERNASRGYVRAIERAGMQARVLDEPSGLLEVLPEFAPDLILINTSIKGCTGIEAAQVIRQHPVYENLPIVFLARTRDPGENADALRRVGDDLLEAPIGDERLAAALRIRAQRFRKLRMMIDRDSLTGLLNHTNLKIVLEREISRFNRRGSPLSFAMLDLDFFKSVNDRFGHLVGDMVIKSLARLLGNRLRKGDIVARYGGEEFAIILPGTLPADARKLLDELREHFSDILFSREEGTFTGTFSAGVSSCPPHCDADSLIAAADDAMYRAKAAGRNRVVAEDYRLQDTADDATKTPG